MRNAALLLGALAVLVLAAAPAGAAAKRKGPIVGIGDQKTAMFADDRFSWLGIRHARLVVPWYVATGRNPVELGYVDRWLKTARAARVQPVVGFGHGFAGPSRTYLPSVREFRRAVRKFRRRYPWVKAYITWNEANHCSQPTCRRPRRVARYYDALARQCRRCRIVAVAVIDQPNMTSWIRRFRRTTKRRPRLYGLHNYLDVNRLRITGTRRLMKALPRRARVWITETGGLVYRRHYRGKADFPESVEHAAKVTRHVLRTTRRFKRITRVYLYHWNVDRFQPTWDSGLVDHLGVARPGFSALARYLGRNPRRAPAPPAPAPAAPLPPGADPPPPTSPEPEAQREPQPESPPPPAEPECSLTNLCIDPLRFG